MNALHSQFCLYDNQETNFESKFYSIPCNVTTCISWCVNSDAFDVFDIPQDKNRYQLQRCIFSFFYIICMTLSRNGTLIHHIISYRIISFHIISIAYFLLLSNPLPSHYRVLRIHTPFCIIPFMLSSFYAWLLFVEKINWCQPFRLLDTT